LDAGSVEQDETPVCAQHRAHLANLLKAKSYGCAKPNFRAVQMLTNQRRPATTAKVSCFFIQDQSPARPTTSYSSERAKQKREKTIGLSAGHDDGGGASTSPPSAIFRSPFRGELQPAARTLNLKFKLEQHRAQQQGQGTTLGGLSASSSSSSSMLATTAYSSLVREVSPTRKEPLRASILRATRSGLAVPPMLVAKYDRGSDPSELARYIEHRNAVQSFHSSPIGHDSKQLKKHFRNTLKSIQKYHMFPHETDVPLSGGKAGDAARKLPMHLRDRKQLMLRKRRHRVKNRASWRQASGTVSRIGDTLATVPLAGIQERRRVLSVVSPDLKSEVRR
jgi:hypothetical protein